MSTRIVEIQDAGTPRERARPEGSDRGFLWRVNAYWTYREVPTGVLAELESLTLSRGIPIGLSAIARPLIEHVAVGSMRRTLEALRRAHTPRATQGAPCP